MNATSNIGIKLSLDGANQAEAGLRRLGTGMGQIESAAQGARAALGGLAGALAGAISVREFVQAADAVTQLQNNLRLATGSAQAAGTAYEQLFAIAQRSRGNFTELGNTFASITRATQSLGLTQRQVLALTETIGNAITVSGASASASQAALMQLGQGLASGVLRGEELNSILEQTPRLAQALADGMGVSVGALRKLGEEGKITAATVADALRSQQGVLAAEVQQSVATVGQAMQVLQNSAVAFVGTLDKATGASSTFAQAIVSTSTALDTVGAAFKSINTQTAPTATLFDGISTVFETVAVLGANVAYVLRGIGTEIGGIAAQAAAVARLDFSQAGEIGRMMRADAASARAGVDALSQRVLNSRTTAALSAPNSYDEPGILRARAAAARDEEAFSAYLAEQAAKEAKAKAAAAAASKAAAAEAKKAAEAELAWRRRYTLDLVKGWDAEAEARTKAQDAAAKATGQYYDGLQKELDTLDGKVAALRAEGEQIGLTASGLLALTLARQDHTIALEAERLALLQGNEGSAEEILLQQRRIALLQQQRDLTASNGQRQIAADSAKSAAEEWKRTSQQIENSLTDALLRGFESGKGFAENLRDTVANMFKTLVLRPVIQATVQGGLNAVGLGGSGGASGGSSLLGQASNAYSMFNSLGTMGSFASSAAVASGATYGTAAFSQQSIMLAAQEAGFSAAAGASAGAASGTIAAAAPYVAAVLAIAAIADATKGESRWGGQYGYNFGDGLTNARRGTEVQGAVLGVNRLEGANTFAEAEVQAAIAGTVGSINALLASAGSSAALVGFQAGLETSGKGRGGVFAGGTLSTGATFGEDGSGDNYLGTLFEKTSTQSPDAQTALANFALDLQQATIQALQAAADVPESLKKMVQGVDAESLTADAATVLLQSIDAQVAGVTQLRAAFDAMGLDQFATFGFDAASALAAAAGGFEALGNKLGSYYQNYYTEAERTALSTVQITEQLAKLGVTLPDSTQAFRAMVDTALAAGDTTLVAGLLGVQDAFAQIEQIAQQATEALIKQARASASTQADAARAASRVSRGLPAFDTPAPYAAAPGGASGSSADLASEMRAMRAEWALLRTEVQAVAGHTAKTAKLLDRAMPDGQSLQTTTVPA